MTHRVQGACVMVDEEVGDEHLEVREEELGPILRGIKIL
jgi:hypothetical protein